MSTITLSGPGTCTVVSRPAWCQCNMTQLTVGVLSQRVPNGACLIMGANSKITPMANTSAASSRSKLVMIPAGLLSVMTLAAISQGNASLYTDGGISSFSKNHTPPAPSAAALW